MGVHPGGGGTERLPHLVGRGRALEIILRANDFDGDTAERYGYVNRALPDSELDELRGCARAPNRLLRSARHSAAAKSSRQPGFAASPPTGSSTPSPPLRPR